MVGAGVTAEEITTPLVEAVVVVETGEITTTSEATTSRAVMVAAQPETTTEEIAELLLMVSVPQNFESTLGCLWIWTVFV